jgi:hypothetical protein
MEYTGKTKDAEFPGAAKARSRNWSSPNPKFKRGRGLRVEG